SIKSGAYGAAGPASAPGSALGRPARRTPGHSSQGTQIRPAYSARRPGVRGAAVLGFDCPAHGHRVNIASGVATPSASQNPDPAPAHEGDWRLRERRTRPAKRRAWPYGRQGLDRTGPTSQIKGSLVDTIECDTGEDDVGVGRGTVSPPIPHKRALGCVAVDRDHGAVCGGSR